MTRFDTIPDVASVTNIQSVRDGAIQDSKDGPVDIYLLLVMLYAPMSAAWPIPSK